MMRIILTEVTEMRNQHICVAGWDSDNERMIRPLPSNRGDHQWSAELARPDHFAVGNIMEFREKQNDSRTDYPHRTEDTVVAGIGMVVDSIEMDDLSNALLGSVSFTLDDVFGGHLVEGKAVTPGTQCASLGAILVNPKRMGVTESYGKLRCWFFMGDGDDQQRFNLPVTSTFLRAWWSKEGTDAIQAMLRDSKSAHIRIGLTRPWSKDKGEPEMCWVQVNGILAEGI